MKNRPDYVFEIGWEVCNKVGGMHTVLTSKAKNLSKTFGDNYIMIGPDVMKDEKNNLDFVEDGTLLKNWMSFAKNENLKIRIGRWNIAGRPIVVLVDFSSFIIAKESLLKDFWDNYKLDSLSAPWDFLEPTMFGYAAGKVIESFWKYHINAHDKVVAQFNEWTSGAGVLHLKQAVPQIATIFTSHGTTLGKYLAKHGISPTSISSQEAEKYAISYGITPKFSLEKILPQIADCYTTVSLVSNDESNLFYHKFADFITPNGFERPYEITEQNREVARNILRKVAKAVLKREIPQDAIFIHTGGQNEFKNKGYDIFLESLNKLNQESSCKNEIFAFIITPSNVCGFRQDLDLNYGGIYPEPAINDYLTHWIFDYETNPIIKAFIENNLHNQLEDRVKVIYVPTYLNGDDGVFNLPYTELLAGFDLTLFPSLYEPWGYASQQSIGIGVPTLSTTNSGFGQWVKSHFKEKQEAIRVIERDFNNSDKTIQELAKIVCDYSKLSLKEKEKLQQEAILISKQTSWNNFLDEYYNAYAFALEKANERFDMYKAKTSISETITEQVKFVKAEWRKILININLPDELKPLINLTKNLWWAWNYEAYELFGMVNEYLWIKHQQNPISMIESLSIEDCDKLKNNPQFIAKLNKVYGHFEAYMAKKSEMNGEKIAYFSMEYGLHDSLKIFSGGLGMLAGDYLKQASDSNVNMIGIGLLYRYGYFSQQISNNGDQINNYFPQKFSHLPINAVRDKNGDWVKIGIPFPGRTLYAKIWRVDVGRIPLYLLDTDFADNSESDRKITASLYGGDWENRLKQEILLGIGGILTINILNEQPTLYHYNEGHAAFAVIERLKNIMQQYNYTFLQASEIIKATSLFTTHTPVPAGHDYFSEDMLRAYLANYCTKLNISWDTFMNLGRMHDNNPNERFSMSVLAVKLSQEVNAVSKIHGRVTRELFKDLYKGYFTEELHIGYVTNGVHYPTWTHKKWQQLHKEYFGDNFFNDQSNPNHWSKIANVPDQKIWDLRNELRKEMIDYLKIRINQDMTRRQESPKLLFDALENLRSDVLTIGFARRFATYKRAHLLFSDLEKLSLLINNPERPVQFIYAGKAHPHDKAGQDLIKRIIEVSRMKEFVGKIIFIENYDMEIAKHLISGCDVWLNTPTRPLEASGTSGEKAIMNGVLNFSVLDGWWAEGYVPGAGWALKEEVTYINNDFQDLLDAETIYNKIEDEIAPAFYLLNQENIPEIWLSHVRNTFSQISPKFTMKRQLDDYYDKFYNILFDRSERLTENENNLAIEITRWKKKMLTSWESIIVKRIAVPNSEQYPLTIGEFFNAEIELDMGILSPNDIGIEVIFAKKQNDVIDHIYKKFDLECTSFEDSIAKFVCNVPAINAGVYDYLFRMYAKHADLAHRQDIDLVKWI